MVTGEWSERRCRSRDVHNRSRDARRQTAQAVQPKQGAQARNEAPLPASYRRSSLRWEVAADPAPNYLAVGGEGGRPPRSEPVPVIRTSETSARTRKSRAFQVSVSLTVTRVPARATSVRQIAGTVANACVVNDPSGSVHRNTPILAGRKGTKSPLPAVAWCTQTTAAARRTGAALVRSDECGWWPPLQAVAVAAARTRANLTRTT